MTSLENADLWLFIPADVLSFLIFFFGETLLFACAFTFFHERTSFSEMLLPMAAVFFLQAANILLAGAALLVFLNRRKKVPWMRATFTLMVIGIVDGIVMALLVIFAAILFPSSPIRVGLPFAAVGLVLMVTILVMRGRLDPKQGALRWIARNDALHAFRVAKLSHYATLGGLRAAILLPQAPLLWVCFRAFRMKVAFGPVAALTPAILLSTSQPITPAGLGPMQAIIIDGLSSYAPASKLLAAGLAVSVAQLLCRLPLGLGAAGTFVRNVMHASGRVEEKSALDSAQSGHRPRALQARRH